MSRDLCKNLTPWPFDGPAPRIIRQMIDAGKKAEIDGIVLIVGGEIGHWGELDMVPLDEKSLEF